MELLSRSSSHRRMPRAPGRCFVSPMVVGATLRHCRVNGQRGSRRRAGQGRVASTLANSSRVQLPAVYRAVRRYAARKRRDLSGSSSGWPRLIGALAAEPGVTDKSGHCKQAEPLTRRDLSRVAIASAPQDLTTPNTFQQGAYIEKSARLSTRHHTGPEENRQEHDLDAQPLVRRALASSRARRPPIRRPVRGRYVDCLFHVETPQAALVDLRRRVATTRWPDRETVTDQSQGVRLATMDNSPAIGRPGYDWRKCEAKLNALPEFVTKIDGVDIQFIWVRSRTRTRCRSLSPTGGQARLSSSSRSSARSPIPLPMVARQRTLSMSSFRRCPATGFPASQLRPDGILFALRAPGSC